MLQIVAGDSLTHEGSEFPVYSSEQVNWHTWSIEQAASGSDAELLRIIRMTPDVPFDELRQLIRAARISFSRVAEATSTIVVPYTLGFARIPPEELSEREKAVATAHLLPVGMALVARTAIVHNAEPIQLSSAEGQRIAQGVRRYKADMRHQQDPWGWVDDRLEELDPAVDSLGQFVIGSTEAAQTRQAYLVDIDHYIAKPSNRAGD